VGGCASGLLITDPAAAPIRETKDVDVIVEIVSRHDYHLLSEKLRKQGFREDQSENAPLCRWTYESVIVDVMPTDSSILGFSNKWYTEAMKTSENIKLPDGAEIRIVSAPLFLATKLEAFYGRGDGDYMASHDLEDIIAILDGRTSLVDEVSTSSTALRSYLSDEFSKLLANNDFQDALPGHLAGDAASQARIGLIIDRMTQIKK
jgi:predicted nucleotidyltransferase